MEWFFLLDLPFFLLVLFLRPISAGYHFETSMDIRKFTVMGPQQPIIALVGEEATFPCHLFPQQDAQDMEVVWFHSQFSHLVHHYKYRQDYVKYQHQEYRGRTEFLQENINYGRVALRLHNIRLSDEGIYRCFFESPSTYGEAEFQVLVAGTGSTPDIHIEGDGNKMLRFLCTSSGWYPKPEVQWKINQENSSSQDTMIEKNENGLFSIEASITVSIHSKVHVSCFIRNPLLSKVLEASVYLADSAFPNASPWIVARIVLIVLVIIGFSIYTFWICK
ncbi:butyrophilin subfamily 2 member A1-like [Macrotis lagotis]|uniref:butyrophilin subfamily 2 member A1-like n=1 Tax=Macrotis lagotis TaxID=92651 RepID=UPI003D69BC1D